MGTPYECGMDGTIQNDSQRCVYQAWGYSKFSIHVCIF